MRKRDKQQIRKPGRQIDRFSLDCFVRGFIINPSETTADYPLDQTRNEEGFGLNADTTYIMLVWSVALPVRLAVHIQRMKPYL